MYHKISMKSVPAHLRKIDGYSGRKFNLEVKNEVNIPADAGTWSGGSRYLYLSVDLATGQATSLVDTISAPWSNRRMTTTRLIVPGIAIVRTGTFEGKPSAPVFYIHPDDKHIFGE